MNRFLTILIAVGLLAAACGADSSTEPASSPTTTSSSPDTTTTATPTTSLAPTTTTTAPAQVVGSPSEGCNGPSAPVTEMLTITTADGLVREYRIHVPASYDSERPMPLVLNLPGAFDTVERQLEVTRAEELADLEGFITVVPVAYEVSPGAELGDGYVTWILNAEAGRADDVGFIEQLLDQLEGDVCIDLDRVFAMGMSAGGRMSTLLGCLMSDRVAAVAGIAGFAPAAACGDGRAPAVLFFGDADPFAPLVLIETDVGLWSADAGCSAEPDVTAISVDFEVEVRSYSGCDGNWALEFYVVEGGGHQWPGDASPLPPLLVECCVPPACPDSGFPCLGVTTLDIDATSVAWEFFRDHPMT